MSVALYSVTRPLMIQWAAGINRGEVIKNHKKLFLILSGVFFFVGSWCIVPARCCNNGGRGRVNKVRTPSCKPKIYAVGDRGTEVLRTKYWSLLCTLCKCYVSTGCHDIPGLSIMFPLQCIRTPVRRVAGQWQDWSRLSGRTWKRRKGKQSGPLGAWNQTKS